MARPRLEPGTTLGPYQIEALLGAGGMGEVYRARDPRLDRPIALKVLPRELADDPVRRKRLLREAHAAAALNHPNICTVHEVGEADGLDYIVFEYIEGQTLESLSEGGSLPMERIVDLALPLCEALAYAHERGIIHRDLKPSNVMLSTLGLPKILDFGAASYLASSPDASTRTRLTHDGAVIGTAGFMSPEQALGLPLDNRTDVFSFGALLYELATGQAAFRGRTMADVTDALLHREPVPVSQLRRDLPPVFDQVVAKALHKSRDERYQLMSNIADALRSLRQQSGAMPEGHGIPDRRVRAIGTRVAVGAVSVLLLVLVTVVYAVFLDRPPDRPAGITFADAATPPIPKGSGPGDVSVREAINAILNATQGVPDTAWAPRKQKLLEFTSTWMRTLGADADSIRRAEESIGRTLDEARNISMDSDRRLYGRRIADAVFRISGPRP